MRLFRFLQCEVCNWFREINGRSMRLYPQQSQWYINSWFRGAIKNMIGDSTYNQLLLCQCHHDLSCDIGRLCLWMKKHSQTLWKHSIKVSIRKNNLGLVSSSVLWFVYGSSAVNAQRILIAKGLFLNRVECLCPRLLFHSLAIMCFWLYLKQQQHGE